MTTARDLLVALAIALALAASLAWRHPPLLPEDAGAAFAMTDLGS